MHIFSEPISCSLCSYQTKVRSNLIIHLHGHEKGQDNTTKEIVNPVPSMGKSELMFDKMINLSASSFEAMNTEKVGIKINCLWCINFYYSCFYDFFFQHLNPIYYLTINIKYNLYFFILLLSYDYLI